MFAVTILAVGKLKEPWLREGFFEYQKRLSAYCDFSVVELPEHPWFVAAQFHPEFKSRPDRPHPLFLGFVKAALETGQKQQPSQAAFPPCPAAAASSENSLR